MKKKRGLFKGWLPNKMGHSCHKAHLSTSVQAEVFVRRERENKTKKSRGGVLEVLYMQASTVYSIRTLKLVT